MLVTRRVTPPTCTLEIEATSSALSRWTKQKAIEDVQFQLSFDDPRLTKEEQVTIEGDRTQLEQLYRVIASYVQNFLQQPSLEQILSQSPSSTNIAPGQLYLKPQGLVTHELFLGSLGNSDSGDKIQLNTVQLFDLVTALEDYQVEIAAIPHLNSGEPQKRSLWSTAVASIVVITGLAILGFNLFNQSSLNFQSASVRESESASEKPKIARDKPDEVIPPQITKSPKKPATQSQLQDPLSSKEKLPPPPPVEKPKAPPANVPDFSKYPLPKIEQIPTVKPKLTKQPKPNQPSNRPSQSELALRSKPENIPIPEVPPLSPSLLPTEADIINNSVAKADDNSSQTQSLQSAEPEKSVTTPQLKEVERYFQQKWQPPAELKQTIEYRLVINSEGSIVRITPIGKASKIFIDRTNIPLMGESFISPSATKGNQIIRLLLSPDGDVKTFLESK